MSEKHDDGIIYHRAKGDAIGAVLVGVLLIGFAVVVLTRDGLWEVPFSADLRVMSTYLALPLGAVLILGHSPHALAKGPTLAAGKHGISVLHGARPVGPIPWSEIRSFRSFRTNGHPCLGIVLEDPAHTLTILGDAAAPLARLARGKQAHIGIRGKMLDAPLSAVVHELEEMRQVHTWHRA